MMDENEKLEGSNEDEIYSKALRAGRRTYFFDVRETRAGDYYLTITESKKTTNEDGSYFYKKHKIYLYKEDFENFKSCLDESTGFVIDEKGGEVISERHQSNFEEKDIESVEVSAESNSTESFTDVSFDDI